MRYFLFITIVAGLTACGPVVSDAKLEDKPFFDLASFIDAEVTRLNTVNNEGLEKTVVINGETETLQDPELDFAKDLAIFRRSDINRTAWIEKYEVAEQGNTTTYRANDESMQTKLLQVSKNAAGEVENIHIERRMGNVLSTGLQTLNYKPSEGYSVVSKQESGLVGDVNVDLRVVF